MNTTNNANDINTNDDAMTPSEFEEIIARLKTDYMPHVTIAWHQGYTVHRREPFRDEGTPLLSCQLMIPDN